MSRIDVTNDGKRFKVMVNFVTRYSLSSAKIANQEATKLKKKELPSYDLNLIAE